MGGGRMLKNTKPRNIKEGDMTYGERIELGRIMRNEDMSDYERIRQVVLCLHDIDVQPKEAAELAQYVLQVIEGLSFWVEQERQQLHIPPTPEETQAGIEEMGKAIGDLGNVVTLAEAFHCSFETIYKKPYTEVFAIQKVHTERAKYERRLNQVYIRKNRQKRP